MHPRGASWSCLVATVVFVFFGLHTSPVEAKKPYGVVTVDLRPEIGEVPTHLCVVSEVSGPRTRRTVDALVLAPAGGSPSALSIDPTVWGDPGDRDGDGTKACGTQGGCSARILLPQGLRRAETLHVACTTDSLLRKGSTADARILVLMLEHLEGSPPMIEALRLTGGVVTIGVQANLDHIVVTARSLGGHYAPDQRSFRANEGGAGSKLIVLPIAPRCHWVEVELPAIRLRESDRARLEVYANGEKIDSGACLGVMRGGAKLRVQIPRSVEEGQLEVGIVPAEGEWPSVTRFGAHWQGSWPSATITMTPNRLGFAWRAPECVFSETECPRATLAGGIECSGERDGELCHYICPGDSKRDELLEIDTPVEIRFQTGSPRQEWTDLLVRPGQTLDEYLPQGKIFLHADISAWRRNVPGNRITHLDVLGSDGTERRYNLLGVDSLRIASPETGCPPLRFRLVGDRRYDEGIAQVRGGHVTFTEPGRTANILSFNLLMAQGGGPSLLLEGRDDLVNPAYFTGLIQLAANFRPHRSGGSRISFELRLGGTVGQYGYYERQSVDDTPRRVTKKIPWARLLFEPAIQMNVWKSLSFSAGLGIGTAWPIRASDLRYVDRFRFIVSPSIDARFSVRKWLAFVAQGRAIFGERTMVPLEANPEVAPKSWANMAILGLYGIVIAF